MQTDKSLQKNLTKEQLGQQHINENLSRVTTHDTPLITGNQFQTADFTKNTMNTGGVSEQLGSGNFIGNPPLTTENEFIQRNLAGVNYGTGIPMTQSINTSIPTTGGLGQGTNFTSQQPIVGGTQYGVSESRSDEQPKKEGFLSKLFHGKAEHTNLPGSQELIDQPAGLLDEKGTTVTLPEGTASNSLLGLPVTGPDYTHGTHGITENTVFTGGLGPNIATNSGPVDVNRGGSFQPGMSGIQPGFDQKLSGVDVSGANATHIERDITLQEGGLLGLRQGAVTGNPGDIITNYVDTGLQKPIQQPVFTQPQPVQQIQQTVVTETISHPVTTEYQERHTTIPPTGLGGDCSLVRNFNKKL